MIIDFIEDVVGALPTYTGNYSYQFNAEMYQYVIACCILLIGFVCCFKLVFNILNMFFGHRKF